MPSQKAIMKIMPCSHMMCPLGMMGNFDNLDGAQHQKPKFAIKEIKIHHVFKARSFEKARSSLCSVESSNGSQ